MSPGEVQIWLAAIAMVGTLIAMMSMVFQGIMAYLMAKMKQGQTEVMANQVIVAAKVEEVASKAETVKTTLEASSEVNDVKFKELAATTKDIHTLVNSGVLKLQEKYMNITEKYAEKTGSQIDADEASVARMAYHDHKSRQTIVDNQSRIGVQEQGNSSGNLSAMEENTLATRANTDAMTGVKPDPEAELKQRGLERPI